jgi:hypothetical protein
VLNRIWASTYDFTKAENTSTQKYSVTVQAVTIKSGFYDPSYVFLPQKLNFNLVDSYN